MKAKKITMFVIGLIVWLGLNGCTDAQRGKIASLGKNAKIIQ